MCDTKQKEWFLGERGAVQVWQKDWEGGWRRDVKI